MSGSRGNSEQLDWGPDPEDAQIEAELNAIEERLRNLPERFKQGNVQFADNDDTDEEQAESEVIPDLAYVIDLTGDAPAIQRRPSQIVRNLSVSSQGAVEHYEIDGIKLEPGSTVEVQAREQPQLFKASFLHVKHIIDTAQGTQLRGIPLTRLKNLRGRLPRHRNEVAMILLADSDDARADEVQAAIEIPITDVIRIRHCHFTNADYPKHRTVVEIHSTPADLSQKGVLMCRWKCVFKYRDSATRIAHIEQTLKKAAPMEYIIQHLNANQVHKQRFKESETSRLNTWRGGNVRGGGHDPERRNNSKGPVVQLDGEEDSELLWIEKKPGQRYTFGDMFCGAGGASLGAQKSGFYVKIACDHHLGACKTFAEVFPESKLYIEDIFNFITTVRAIIRVDVLHLSPPCQFWSPAHTVAGVNDDANIAALFACCELVRMLRPRLVTLEQTFGILHPQFEFYFNSLVHGFTVHNYSVRWKIVDLVQWGSPAARKRLIMIGSCAGEELPPFPEASHVAPDIHKPGKRPYVTVQKMLARIPRDASDYDELHQPQDMARKRLKRWDPNVTLRRTITTNGGYGNYHPNGRRDFTLREYATLQTFPVNYPFHAPDKKKQIGNAFPPLVVKVLYTHLRKWLEKQDRVYAIENEPIDLDDPDVEILDLEDNKLKDKSNDGEDVEYMGSRRIVGSSSSSGGSPGDNMDLGTSNTDHAPIPCIDANQRPRRRVRSTAGRTGSQTGGQTGRTQSYIDLTGDDV